MTKAPFRRMNLIRGAGAKRTLMSVALTVAFVVPTFAALPRPRNASLLIANNSGSSIFGNRLEIRSLYCPQQVKNEGRNGNPSPGIGSVTLDDLSSGERRYNKFAAAAWIIDTKTWNALVIVTAMTPEINGFAFAEEDVTPVAEPATWISAAIVCLTLVYHVARRKRGGLLRTWGRFRVNARVFPAPLSAPTNAVLA
jgi:hypothetical protein